MNSATDGRRSLHIISGLGTGGAEMMLTRLLQNSPRLAAGSTVLCLGSATTLAPLIADAGSRVITLHARKSDVVGSVVNVRRLLHELAPVAAVGWMPHGNVVAALAGAANGSCTRVVWNVRASLDALHTLRLSTRLLYRAEPMIAPLVDVIICNSQRAAGQYSRVLRGRTRTVVISNGFAERPLALGHPERDAYRASLAIPAGAVALLHVARYHPIKGHALMARALAALDRRFVLICVGLGVSWNNLELVRLFRASDLERVRLHDEKGSLERFFIAADIAVCPSLAEGFPTAIGEGMAFGLPAAVTDVGDAARLVGDTGAVAGRSGAALAKAVSDLAERMQADRAAVCRAAQNRVRVHFSLRATIGAFERELCGS